MLKDDYLYISPEGLKKWASVYDSQDPQKNYNWTTDHTVELPIRMAKSGPGAAQPITLMEMWEHSLKQNAQKPALSVKRNNKWQTLTFQEYYSQSCHFAQALLSIGVSANSAVNILGFNSPEWMIAFYGSIFGFYLPVGIYTTNQPEACHYISEHSDCEAVVLENKEQLQKYLKIWDSLPKLKAIIIYNDRKAIDIVPEHRRAQVFQWLDFLQMGAKFRAKNEENSLENRMKQQKPGNCCCIVYTSGTTGPPKGVMLSHDNYVFGATNIINGRQLGDRLVSFLPLSHVIAELIDIVIAVKYGMHVYFALPDALQGSLVETLKEARPTIFFTVPRIWEKMEEKMRIIMGQNGFPKKQITNWAMSIGKAGNFAQSHNQSPPLCHGLARSMVFDKVKANLGLDKVLYFAYGAAPMQPQTREFFLNLNIFLMNGYGMSETTGGHTLSFPEDFDKYDEHFIRSTGKSMPGTEVMIFNPDNEGNGEICFRGRNVFMGYFKNEKATRETIDEGRYLHSGDVGQLDSAKNLKITGRLKELIVTAGGENVAPVLIENEILKALPIVSYAMVVGDLRKYLSVLLTLKHQPDKDGKPSGKLADEVINFLSSKGSKATTTQEARSCKVVTELINKGIEEANKNSVSKAAYVRKWTVIDGDFTIDGGELTPTMKVKRNVVYKKNEAAIERMYEDPKL